jgi:hypothetical protein
MVSKETKGVGPGMSSYRLSHGTVAGEPTPLETYAPQAKAVRIGVLEEIKPGTYVYLDLCRGCAGSNPSKNGGAGRAL